MMNKTQIETNLIMLVRIYMRKVLKVDPDRITDKEILTRVRHTFKSMPESDVRVRR